MPEYRSIHIALHSQFDIETLPEYYPAAQEYYISHGITGFVPQLDNAETSTCSVYIPVFPGSIFWVGYSVSPPVPAGQLFLFKLYINGAHVVSWSTGQEEQWKGKTMFGLFESPEDEDGRRRVEKRALSFKAPDMRGRGQAEAPDMFDENACIEIRVHRATGRQRVERELQEYVNTEHAKNPNGIDLVEAGRAGPHHPNRFYKFALIDPVDQPFANFRYYYRTWEQLRSIGLLDDEYTYTGEENDLSVIEPYEGNGNDMDGNEDILAEGSTHEEEEKPAEEVYDSAEETSGTSTTALESDQVMDQSGTEQQYCPDPDPVESMDPTVLTQDDSGEVLGFVPPEPKRPYSIDSPDPTRQERSSYVRTPPNYYRQPNTTPVPVDSPKEDSRCRSKASQVSKVSSGRSTPWRERDRDQGFSAWHLTDIISAMWRRLHNQSPASKAATKGKDGAEDGA